MIVRMNRTVDRRDLRASALNDVVVAGQGTMILSECTEMHGGSSIIVKDSPNCTFEAKHGIEILIA